jgi:hypothetical protein
MYSLVFCLLASVIPFWPMTEFPKPGQKHVERQFEELRLMGNPTDAYLDNADHYCQDSLSSFWDEVINTAFDSRMTGTGYLRENTFLLVWFGGGAFLVFVVFNGCMVGTKRSVIHTKM